MFRILFLVFNILKVVIESEGATLEQQLVHLARRRQESRNLIDDFRRVNSDASNDEDALFRSDPRAREFIDEKAQSDAPKRKHGYRMRHNSAPKRKRGNRMRHNRRSLFQYDPNAVGPIIGAPSMPSHLPQAEPILPGHTLLRPAMGMLKSSVKFPHRDLEDGAGVYGNIKNLGIKYDGKNERVLYTGFRRTPSGRRINYIPIEPDSSEEDKAFVPWFKLNNLVLDLDRNNMFHNGKIIGSWESMKSPIDNKLILYLIEPRTGTLYLTDRLRSNEKKNKHNYEQEYRDIVPRKSDEDQTESSEEMYKWGSDAKYYLRDKKSSTEAEFEYQGAKKWFNEAGQGTQDLLYTAWEKMKDFFG